MGTHRRRRIAWWIIAGALLAAFVVYVFMPAPIHVETVIVARSDLEGFVEAEGFVRVADHYVLALPVAATLLRVRCEAGDSVVQGQTIASYMPPPLDARQREELSARQLAARAAVAEATARMQAVRPVLEQARRKHERLRRLLAAGAVAKEQEEVAFEALLQYEAERQAAEARVAYSRHELDVISAAAKAPSGSVMTLRAPVSGVVLRRFEQQERLLPAGTPVVAIGDPASADIIADVLSMDAVSIRPGMQAFVERWGGAEILRATVRRVEPAARTVVSALGIEERRVYVTLALDTMALALGDNYKVDTRIRLWRRPSVLTVPLSALLRDGASWHVFVVANTRAERKRVTLGMRTSLVAEITSGLQEGDRVIIHPPAVLTNKSRVREW